MEWEEGAEPRLEPGAWCFSTGIFSEVIVEQNCPVHFKCLLSLALLTERQEWPLIIVTTQSIPCLSSGITGMRKK